MQRMRLRYIYLILISLRRIIGFTSIQTPTAGLPGFSASTIFFTGHVPGMFGPRRIYVSVNTQTSGSISLMRASSSSSLLQATLIFHVKILNNLVEHPGRYMDSVLLLYRADFGAGFVLVWADCDRCLVSSGSLLRQCTDLQIGYQNLI